MESTIDKYKRLTKKRRELMIDGAIGFLLISLGIAIPVMLVASYMFSALGVIPVTDSLFSIVLVLAFLGLITIIIYCFELINKGNTLANKAKAVAKIEKELKNLK